MDRSDHTGSPASPPDSGNGTSGGSDADAGNETNVGSDADAGNETNVGSDADAGNETDAGTGDGAADTVDPGTTPGGDAGAAPGGEDDSALEAPILSAAAESGTENETVVEVSVSNPNGEPLRDLAVSIDGRPAGWAVRPGRDDGGSWRSEAREWSWLALPAGCSRTVAATLHAPATADAGEYAIEATAPAGGLSDEATVAVALQERDARTIAAAIAGPDGVANTSDVLRAIDRWQIGAPVPGTDGEAVSTATVLDLVERRVAGRPVAGPPGSSLDPGPRVGRFLSRVIPEG